MKIMNINTKFIILLVKGRVLGKLVTRLHNRPFEEEGTTKFHELMKSKFDQKSKVDQSGQT